MSFMVLSLVVVSMLWQATPVAPTSCPDKPIAAAWYAGWGGFPLSAVSWDKYNTLIYSFAVTTPSVNSLSLNGSEPSLLPQFVSQAHENGVAAHIAVGGWGGDLWYSSNTATPENRTAFVKTVVDFAEQYNLDGVNFDWEYPNKQGIGCSIISVNDTQNFLYFLQELRADPVGAELTLSATGETTPFRDAFGKPSTNVSGFAEVLDYITIMNYDIWGSWSLTVGPNTPLNDTCAAPTNQVGSAFSAVKAWTAAGMPVNKIVLGVASYGHSFSVPPNDAFVTGSKTELMAYPKFNASNQPLSAPNITGYVDVCGIFEAPAGIFTFKDLVNGGFLTTEGKPASGINYRFDNCSQTSYVYNGTSEVMISFDDPQSFAAKGNYIKGAGLKGFSMWNAGDDYNDLLLDSIRSAAGFDTPYTYKRDWNWKW
ncbi:glycoside hydrolase family 18 protein [Boletus coccyginus]|nr:glycoside hydrolase family 18 protein [Boletus coccyginus]